MTREYAKLAGRIRQGKEKSQGEKAPDEGLAEVLAADFTDGNLCINQAAKAPLRHVMTPKIFREKRPRASGSGFRALSNQLITADVAAALCAAPIPQVRGTECRGYISIRSVLVSDDVEALCIL
jgi:hypothetical protein